MYMLQCVCMYTCMRSHPQRLSSRTNSTLKVWNADTATLLRTLSGHSSSVTCVRWTGNNFLVSSSQDKTMKVCAALPPVCSQQCEAGCQLQLLGWCVSVSVSVSVFDFNFSGVGSRNWNNGSQPRHARALDQQHCPEQRPRHAQQPCNGEGGAADACAAVGEGDGCGVCRAVWMCGVGLDCVALCANV